MSDLLTQYSPELRALGELAVLWLFVSLLSLVEHPKEGGVIAWVCVGAKRWGLDLPGTAHWLRDGGRRLLEYKASLQLGKAGVVVAAIESGTPDETPTPLVQDLPSQPVILPPPPAPQVSS